MTLSSSQAYILLESRKRRRLICVNSQTWVVGNSFHGSNPLRLEKCQKVGMKFSWWMRINYSFMIIQYPKQWSSKLIRRLFIKYKNVLFFGTFLIIKSSFRSSRSRTSFWYSARLFLLKETAEFCLSIHFLHHQARKHLDSRSTNI